MTCNLQYYSDLQSPFSSRTHLLGTALGFAHNSMSSMIAVLDTRGSRARAIPDVQPLQQVVPKEWPP